MNVPRGSTSVMARRVEPPGCARRLTKPDDRAKYAAWSLAEAPAPLLEAGAA